MCARILVIDDDPVNLDLMIYLLNAFGHVPVPKEDAEAGLEAMRSTPFELILCDIQMPGVDGFEFLRRLKAEGRYQVPVIGVTALAMVGDREKVLGAGFDGYMPKPITPETFVNEVERFLSGPGRPQLQTPRPAERPSASTEPVPQPKERNNVRVLVVDNEPANIAIIRLLLEHSGYEVLTAHSGEQGLEVARKERPHVVVSDLHMPAGNGFDFISGMRRDPRLRNTPFIFVSSTVQASRDVQKGLAMGAAHFLVRPFEPDLLLDALSKCLSDAGAGDA